jgi:hypothetical protein
MTRKILTTFGIGAAQAALDISLPAMAAYARRHGYQLVVPSPAEVVELCEGRPPSWGKIPWLESLLEDNPDSIVLWLDADVVVCRHDVDILRTVQGSPPFLSMVVQNTPDGDVPSCGVMLINNGIDIDPENWPLANYRRIWRASGPDGMNSPRSQNWWEQAAVIRWLGGDPDQQPIVTPPQSDLWGQLPYEWNPHPCDPRGVPSDCRFFHATATGDRLGAMREWAAKHPIPSAET